MPLIFIKLQERITLPESFDLVELNYLLFNFFLMLFFANITPIHKDDERETVENYRSVSLLPIPAKCLERLIHTTIYDHVSTYLSEWQHEFVKGRSCETQLVLTHHQWARASYEGRQVDVAFLDFSKAFDKVSHSVLQKLCSFGISGALLQWCPFPPSF